VQEIKETKSAVRVRFIRGEELKYISHLDMIKLFERAFRRANIPVAYSRGFNPHPIMVFGLPLSVGVTSEAEYADFELESKIHPLDFMEKLNRELPVGISVPAAKEKQAKANIMASIVQASYDILVSSQDLAAHKLYELVENLIDQPEVIVEKEGKRGVKFVNIRPMIYKIYVNTPVNLAPEYSNYNSISQISAVLSAGSRANLKPEMLISALNKINKTNGFAIRIEKIHRTGLFVEKDGKILDPLDISVLSNARD
jgi:radical SAM-linked protein